MSLTPALLPDMISAVADTIEQNAETITALDQAIGDGDHVINLRRGIQALLAQREELSQMEDWPSAWQKIGMTLMSTVGGASGSLYGTLFLTMSKAGRNQTLDFPAFTDIFSQGVESVKQRGKADAGEKTLLDVLIPVTACLCQAAAHSNTCADALKNIPAVAIAGMEATRDMVASKGRASFLGERSRGHIDAGAKTMQLMICAVVAVLAESTPPA
ncbi:MAG: dihydroxyacetone kinase subunit L [Gammaproteobacteria bacterium HGW-Gammaproteobacteria-3]|nr:MAG: dihydroxyacetone kinase subunit L [Gammaproteobacteria bacterium HGW-Gammaproteobacteria-3]